MKLICPGFTGGLTVIPPLETCELFWANFAFTTLFSSWNIIMMLQPKYKLYQYDIYPLQKKTQQRTNNRTFYKYKKSERDFLVTEIGKIPYRLRNAACRPLHVLLQTFSCSYAPCIFSQISLSEGTRIPRFASLSVWSLILLTSDETRQQQHGQ